VRAKYPHETRERIVKALAVQLGRTTKNPTAADRVSVLNYIAHEFREEDRLSQLGRVLESRIRRHRPDWLEGELFVAFGERAKFKPLKVPGSYRLVDASGDLRRLGDLAPASVDAIMAWWFDGYPQLRLYVITEVELARDKRDEMQRIACEELPGAIGEWYASMPQRLDPGRVLASE